MKEEFLQELYSLLDQPRKSTYLIHNTANDLFYAGRFAECDALFSSINICALDTFCISALLACTLCAKEHLPSRAKWLSQSRHRLHEIAPDRIESLLMGLE